MLSKTKLAKIFQIGLIVICTSLALLYFTEPLRFQVVHPISSWASRLAQMLGLSREDNEMLLAPSDAIETSAQPQSELAGNYLLGCDRALQGEQLYLVTDWRRAGTTDRTELHFQFLLPNRIVQEITRTLDQSQLFIPLPAGFYLGDQPGTIWLKREGSDDEQWMQVCQ